MPDDVIVLPPVILRKPAYREPCNGCGYCCAVVVCRIGLAILPDAQAPCPMLEYKDGRHWCGVVLAEEKVIEERGTITGPTVKEMLGIETSSTGCDSQTWEEWEKAALGKV